MNNPLTKHERSVLTCLDCGSINKPLHEENCTAPDWGYQYPEEAVLSALALLKDKINDLYHKLGKADVWGYGNDEVVDLCEEHIKKAIDECFQIGRTKQ